MLTLKVACQVKAVSHPSVQLPGTSDFFPYSQSHFWLFKCIVYIWFGRTLGRTNCLPFTYLLSFPIGYLGNLQFSSISNCDNTSPKNVKSEHLALFLFVLPPFFFAFSLRSSSSVFWGEGEVRGAKHSSAFHSVLKTFYSAQFGLLNFSSVNLGSGVGQEVKPGIANVLYILPLYLISYTQIMAFKQNNQKECLLSFLVFDVGIIMVICHRAMYHLSFCRILMHTKIPA